MDAHRDLATLIRIPLFLSLLLTTWDGEAPLPNGRAHLIENYLTTLFRPDAHKGTPRPVNPDQLRMATEALSFDLLERGEIGAGEWDVRKVMAAHADGGVSADHLYDDAIRCGLLRRQGGGRLAFPFPIVQEYLAACHLIAHRKESRCARRSRGRATLGTSHPVRARTVGRCDWDSQGVAKPTRRRLREHGAAARPLHSQWNALRY